VSFVVTELFLDANGYDLVLDDAAAVATWRALAARELGEDDLTGVLRGAINQASAPLRGELRAVSPRSGLLGRRAQ
jgi:prophage maintenance system killer protein